MPLEEPQLQELLGQVKVQRSFASYTHLSLNRSRLIHDEQFLFSKIKTVFYILKLFTSEEFFMQTRIFRTESQLGDSIFTKELEVRNTRP